MNEICENCRKTKAEHPLTAPATSDGICTFSPSGLVAVSKEFVEAVIEYNEARRRWLEQGSGLQQEVDAWKHLDSLLAQMKKEW